MADGSASPPRRLNPPTSRSATSESSEAPGRTTWRPSRAGRSGAQRTRIPCWRNHSGMLVARSSLGSGTSGSVIVSTPTGGTSGGGTSSTGMGACCRATGTPRAAGGTCAHSAGRRVQRAKALRNPRVRSRAPGCCSGAVVGRNCGPSAPSAWRLITSTSPSPTRAAATTPAAPRGETVRGGRGARTKAWLDVTARSAE